jgi:hypothetical protein
MPEHDERIRKLYARSRERQEPSAGLDDRILREARRAVTRRPRHYPALALAATLVLGVGLAWLQLGEPPRMTPSPEERSAPPPSPTQSPVQSMAPDNAADMAAAGLAAPAHEGAGSAEAPEPAARAKAAERSAIESLQAPTGDCPGAPDSDRRADWDEAIESARRAGDQATARCLVSAFRERFGSGYDAD